MSITTTTHLNFRHGEARAALDFYAAVFHGETTVSTYGDMGMPRDLPDAGKVIFGQVVADTGFRVMAYDVPGEHVADGVGGTGGETRRENGTTFTNERCFVSVRADTLEEASEYWDGLNAGATVIEPLAASAWSAGFGMLTDAFGVTWVIDVQS